MDKTAHPKPFWRFFFGGVVLILLFLIAVKLLTGMTPAAPAEDAARSEERTKAHEALAAEDELKLTTYAWADKAKGTVQIPIKHAIELTISELAERAPAPAGPIVPPTPAPATEGAPAAATEASPATAPDATPATEPAAPQPVPAN